MSNCGECRMLTCAPKRPVRNGQAGTQTRFGESPPFCMPECRGSTGHHTHASHRLTSVAFLLRFACAKQSRVFQSRAWGKLFSRAAVPCDRLTSKRNAIGRSLLIVSRMSSRCPTPLINVNDIHYRFNGSSRRGRQPRGDVVAGFG